MWKVIVVGVVALILGLAAGFFLGRMTLEREWRNPLVSITLPQEKKSSEGDADPTPSAGARVVKPMPLGRTRAFVGQMTKDDPLVLKVGSVGSGDEGSELHLVIENRSKCKITGFDGVAYGFDATGMPQKLNKHGEHYLAFSGSKVEIEPGALYTHSAKVRYPESASLAVAHVDKVTCAEGPGWQRK